MVARHGQWWQLINHLSGLIDCDDCVYQLLELIGPAVSLFMVCASGAWLCGMANDDNSSIIFRGWLSVMIVLPATRTDWASCKFVHGFCVRSMVVWYGQWWQLINHLSGLIVCDDGVYQLLELIGPAVSLCMVCVSEAWLCGMASDDNSSIIFRGWLSVMIVLPATRTDWASCKLLVAWYGQRWQLINHLSGVIVCDDCVTSY